MTKEQIIAILKRDSDKYKECWQQADKAGNKAIAHNNAIAFAAVGWIIWEIEEEEKKEGHKNA